MLRILLLLIGLYCASITECSAQDNKSIILNSLIYIDKQLHLNLHVVGELILVEVDGKEYVVDEFYDMNNDGIQKVKLFFKLNSKGNARYDFGLICGSRFEGSFKIIESNGAYFIDEFWYISSVE